MASTQKKGNSRKKTPAPPPPPAYNAAARMAGGIVCALLALCVLVSYFNVDALLLTFIAKALKGTLGCGYYLAAPALLGVAVIQLRHQGRPVILRTTCTLLVPLLAGVLWHLIFCRTAYELGGGLLPLLWKDGQTLGCGGVVAGGLALGSEALVSKVVSIIIFVVLLLAALLGALHMTPQQAVDKMREYRDSRWDDEDGEDDLPDDDFEPLPRRRTSSAPEKPVKEKPVRKRAGIDIPLDGEPSAMESGAKKEFFARKSDTVRTPDQVLEQKAAPEPAPTVQEAAPVKEPVSAKTKKAQLQQEVESAAQEVSQAIEQELAQGEETYRYPPITLLEENHADNCTEVGAELRNNSRRLAETLKSFGVDARAGDVVRGPSVTRYEFTLDQGVKLSKITNLADDIALMEWLHDYIWPFEARQTADDVALGMTLGVVEMLLGGVTSFVDMYYFENRCVETVERLGIRAMLGCNYFDSNVDEVMPQVEEAVRLAAGCDRVQIALAPHSPYTVSPENLLRGKRLADKYGLHLMIHISETQDEVRIVREKYGKTSVEHLDGLGLLGPKTIGAHCIHVTDSDIETLAARGVAVSHNPQSNMKISSGVAPVERMRAAGALVTVGTDGTCSNNDLDMFEEVRTAAFLQKSATGDPVALPAWEALRLATVNGARAMGYADGELGVVREGALADLIVVDLQKPHLQPVNDVVSNLVYCGKASDVDTVVVDGRIVVENRCVAGVDLPALYAGVAAAVARIKAGR